MRTGRIGSLLPLIPCLSFLEGPPQDSDHGALCPSVGRGLPRRNRLLHESPVNGRGTEPVIHEPALQGWHKRGFGLANF